jgi:hexosaminidase
MLAMLLPFLCSSSLQRTEDPSLIPFPQQIALLGGHLNLQKGIYVISHDTILSEEVDYLITALKVEGISIARTGFGNRIPLHLSLDPAMDSLGPEAYRLQIRRNEALIPGFGSGWDLLRHSNLIAAGSNRGKKHVPCMDISDRPRFTYRGMHLDVCRHFFGVDFIKDIGPDGEVQAQYLHWHLTERPGMAVIEIKRYPSSRLLDLCAGDHGRKELQSISGGWDASWRNTTTQEEVREIIAYAARRHIEVIPEIEMPGHSLGRPFCLP